MVTKKIMLGSNELKLLFTVEKEEKTAFSIDDAKRILRTSEASIWNVIYRLKAKGRIEEIERGKYLLIPSKAGYEGKWSEIPFLIVPNIVDEYYISFWSALNFWRMTEQVPHTVFVVITKRKRDVEYGPTTFKFVTLSKKKFFGFTEETIAGGKFNIATKEKTIVDCLAFPKYCGGLEEIVKGIWTEKDELDFSKAFEYARRIDVSIVVRKLGYILSLLELKDKGTSKIASTEFKGFQWLDPLGPKKVLEYSKEYGLMINRTKKELTSWMEY
ncbi:MAG TPA: transcriptional regulator [archaeon]|nr:transcriptional regulator [archaeon]